MNILFCIPEQEELLKIKNNPIEFLTLYISVYGRQLSVPTKILASDIPYYEKFQVDILDLILASSMKDPEDENILDALEAIVFPFRFREFYDVSFYATVVEILFKGFDIILEKSIVSIYNSDYSSLDRLYRYTTAPIDITEDIVDKIMGIFRSRDRKYKRERYLSRKILNFIYSEGGVSNTRSQNRESGNLRENSTFLRFSLWEIEILIRKINDTIGDGLPLEMIRYESENREERINVLQKTSGTDDIKMEKKESLRIKSKVGIPSKYIGKIRRTRYCFREILKKLNERYVELQTENREVISICSHLICEELRDSEENASLKEMFRNLCV